MVMKNVSSFFKRSSFLCSKGQSLTAFVSFSPLKVIQKVKNPKYFILRTRRLALGYLTIEYLNYKMFGNCCGIFDWRIFDQ